MSRYRKIDPKFWNDQKILQLSSQGKLCLLYILTHPALTGLGIIRANRDGIHAELGISEDVREGKSEGIGEAIALGIVLEDAKSNCLVIPNFILYNFPESINVVKGWVKLLELIPECPISYAQYENVKNVISEKAGENSAIYEVFMACFMPNAMPKLMPKPMPCAIHKAQSTEHKTQNTEEKNYCLATVVKKPSEHEDFTSEEGKPKDNAQTSTNGSAKQAEYTAADAKPKDYPNDFPNEALLGLPTDDAKSGVLGPQKQSKNTPITQISETIYAQYGKLGEEIFGRDIRKKRKKMLDMVEINNWNVPEDRLHAVVEHMGSILRRLQEKRSNPPNSLRYFSAAVQELLEYASRPASSTPNSPGQDIHSHTWRVMQELLEEQREAELEGAS